MKKLVSFALVVSTFALAENYNWGNVRFDGGGFVSAVIAHPAEKDLVYARTDVGGVYRWNETASTWVPLMDFLSEADKGLYGTESFAIDITDPKRLYILGGTGYFSDGRTAIFRSEDYGQTFDTSYVDFYAHGNGMGRQTGEKLAVDPLMPNILLCGSRTKGLFKSTDYGKTWSNLYEVALSSATGNALTNVNGISFVLFDETQGKLSDGSTATIYMGISARENNLMVSKDGGKSWQNISGGPANLMPHRAKIANGNLYITYSSSEGPHSVSSGAFYKMNIATGNWENLTPFQDESTTARMGDGSQSASHGFGGVSIDPNDPNHIVITTLCYYGGRHLYENGMDNYGDRIYVTTDGGKTWSHGQGYNDGVNVDANGTSWIPGNAIHWAGSIEFDPFNTKRAWVTSGNGVFRTEDLSAKVPLWKFMSKGIEETVPLDLVSVVGGPLVTAIGDYDGAVYTNFNESSPRHSPAIGTTESMGYAPLTGMFLRAGVVTDYSTGTGLTSNIMYVSKDNAATWKEVPTEMGAKGLTVLNADGSVFMHRPENSNSVYRSADGGWSWSTVIGLDGQSQYAKIVADPVNPKVFYLVDAQGYLKRSNDAGETFVNSGTRLQNDAAGEYYNGSGYVRVVPGREGHLWVPLDQSQVWLPKGYSENGLAYTENGGETWTRLKNVSTAIAVGIGKAAEGADYETIFIWGVAGGTENPLGIYRSIDKGETWVQINDEKHVFGGPGNGNFVMGDMNIFGVVYMSTVGRGLIVGAPEDVDIMKISRQKQLATHLLMYQNKNLKVHAPNGAKLEILNAKGERILYQSVMQQNISLKHLSKGIYFARLTTASGNLLQNLSFPIK